MHRKRVPAFTRRKVLSSGAALAIGATLPSLGSASSDFTFQSDITLKPAAGRGKLHPQFQESASFMQFNGSLPGPEIRVRQGSNLRVTVENGLKEETTVHWHGIRTPNAMDGVPYLTQKPISPGGRFTYEFSAPDAGTFWYHPHMRSYEQVGRGLYGALIVEEKEPIKVDRDLTWILDDWRVNKSGEIQDNFGNGHDMSHSGRIGNLVTINGRKMDKLAVRKGERVRLRLINAANARIFALDFQGHTPSIIAMDGQPVEPHHPDRGLVILGPAMRVDLVLDMQEERGSHHAVMDRFYKGLTYQLTSLNYTGEPLREHVPDWSLRLPANPL
ncbi:MAG: multicopper oxidase domain-containing protein, partial [Sneathiella sp.]|nr:multicopper oxidase domain-containing protein [Sneathiella sp.]